MKVNIHTQTKQLVLTPQFIKTVDSTDNRNRIFSKVKNGMGYIKLCHHPPPPTTIHHHPPPAKICPPSPTNTTQKIDHHPEKTRINSNITSFWHCFNNFFFFEIRYSFTWQRFCVIKFWSVKFFKVYILRV